MFAGFGSQTAADWVFEFCKVLGSSIASSADGTKNPVQYHVIGLPGWDLTGDEPTIDLDETAAEVSSEAEVYSSLGMLGRPLPPVEVDGASEHAEVVCIKQADGLLPISVRDIRLRMGGDAPNEGTVAFVGYGGGYHSISPVANDDLDQGSIHVIYCPYAFDSSGVATKAHSIILDPTDDGVSFPSISIVHAEGMALTMSGEGKKAILMKNAAGDASFRLDDDGITATAATIVLSGGVIVGEPVAATALLPGTASQGSAKFFLSP
jgi:hypothetical protein